MTPCLRAGDYALMNKREPWGRWSIVVIRHPETPESIMAQRVVGLPGEIVEIMGNSITVDGKTLDMPPGLGAHENRVYLGRLVPELRGRPGAGCTGNPIRLGPDEYYLLGDNAAVALDSRLWERAIDGRQLGAVPANRILGRVTAIYWPPSRWRIFKE
jgi:signal peptidase I